MNGDGHLVLLSLVSLSVLYCWQLILYGEEGCFRDPILGSSLIEVSLGSSGFEHQSEAVP
jgi:hypothetical protein